MKLYSLTLLAISLIVVAGVAAAPDNGPSPTPAYRTDGGDDKLPWYQLKPTEFPPANSSHRERVYVSKVDPINRTGQFRIEDKDKLDLETVTDFTMLPYGTINCLGAPATLGDVPPGTRFHAQLYQDPKGSFSRVLNLSDDFSVAAAEGSTYRVEEVKAAQGQLFVVPERAADKPAESPQRVELRFNNQTRWWKGRCLASAADVAVGQSIRFNLTYNIPNLPPAIGRCTGIWLDEESQDLATTIQAQSYRAYILSRGLTARIDHVENDKKIVTVTLLDTGDHGLQLQQELPIDRPMRIAIAEESLRTYNPGGNLQGGQDAMPSAMRSEALPYGDGCGGARLVLEPRYLLEGFRPGRIARIFPEHWTMPSLPIEERLPR